MKQYNVTVNGTKYEITLEVVDAADVKAAPAPAAAPAATPAPVAAPAATNASGENVTAPMPGNILKVNVTAGQAVKKGDVLMILEAMKMENEILAPADCTVASVNTTAGTTVEAGTVLCTLA